MKRNVLWLTMDHVTFHHYRHLKGALPTLDTYEKLARQGHAFTRCKSGHPLCLPCRASMLTGVYTHKHGQYRNGKFDEKQEYPLIGDILRGNGWQAAYFGKNHSGYEDLSQHGFEGWTPGGYGNPYMSAPYADFLAETGYDHPVYMQEWCMKPSKLGFSAFPNGPHDLTVEDDFNQNNAGYMDNAQPVHESDFLVYLAEKWLADNSGKPFVLRVDTWGPHHAYQPPLSVYGSVDAAQVELPPSLHALIETRPDFVQRFLDHCHHDMPIDNDDTWRYLLARAYEQYTYIDQALGRLIARLEALGLAESTAILMTADHGDALGTAGGMFDKSGDMQEELMEVPMVLYAPWSRGSGPVDSLTSNLDVVPTILDLLDLEVPAYMDGISLLALAEGRAQPREALMCEHYGHFVERVGQRVLYRGDHKLTVTQDAADQLYDLKQDPYEMDNLAGDAAHAELLAEMHAALAREQAKYGDDRPWYQEARPLGLH